MNHTENDGDTDMFIGRLMAVSLLTVVASSAIAADMSTKREEHRGALGGAVLGAAIAGPVGAGAGAILGGGVFGKLWGKMRLSKEYRVERIAEIQSLKDHAQTRSQHIAELNQDIDTLLAKSTAWQSRQLPIQFKTASSEIEGHYEPQLREVASLLSRNPDTSVVLSGFADRRGNSDYNLQLSEQRVTELKAYLLSHGVQRNQVITQAFGESQPVAAEGSAENDFFDRRVVMAFEVDIRSPLATR
ncbi:MAG: sortase system peptidoglycan-associated protein [Candidatus Azotimanducaceae bacterium]